MNFKEITKDKKKLSKDIYIRYLEKVIKILLKTNKQLMANRIKLI